MAISSRGIIILYDQSMQYVHLIFTTLFKFSLSLTMSIHGRGVLLNCLAFGAIFKSTLNNIAIGKTSILSMVFQYFRNLIQNCKPKCQV